MFVGHGPVNRPRMRESDREDSRQQPSRLLIAALLVTLLGFLARLWTAHGTFLNPDEALHFRLANQPSLLLAYKAGLTNPHPPLLFFLLYFWRILGTSEICLRLPSVLAGTVFCWVFFKWLVKAAGLLAGFIGLLFTALLPPIVELAAEVRQYALLMAFLAGALYFLDEAFEKNSALRMAASSVCLYLAMVSHYSGFWFAAALGIYALCRILAKSPPAGVVGWWIGGQILGLALAFFLYKTHLSKLGRADPATVLSGWASDNYLRRLYFDSAHNNPVTFLVGRSFGLFQYFAGQLAVGDVMGLLFLIGVAQLLGSSLRGDSGDRRLALILILPFAIAWAASMAHVYPYAGTRHMAFLVIPAMAGVSVALARLASGKWPRGLGMAVVLLLACIVFFKPRQPWISRAEQSRTHMSEAMNFIRQNVGPSDTIFTDYEGDLILGHYLCGQQPIAMEPAPAGYAQFSCAGHRIIGKSFRWIFAADQFPQDWQDLMQAFVVKPGAAVWVWEAGWATNIADDLQEHASGFHDLRYQAFGKNIKIFKLTAGEQMPAVPSSGANSQSGAPSP